MMALWAWWCQRRWDRHLKLIDKWERRTSAALRRLRRGSHE